MANREGGGSSTELGAGQIAGVHEIVKSQLPEWRKVFQNITGERVSDEKLEAVFERVAESTYQAVTVRISNTLDGEWPSLSIAREFSDVYPAAIEDTYSFLKAEQKHRHDWENRELELSYGEGRRRDYALAANSIIGMAFAFFLAYMAGGNTAAYAFAAFVVIALALGGAAIIFGRQFVASHDGKNTKVEVGSSGTGQPPATSKTKRTKR